MHHILFRPITNKNFIIVCVVLIDILFGSRVSIAQDSTSYSRSFVSIPTELPLWPGGIENNTVSYAKTGHFEDLEVPSYLKVKRNRLYSAITLPTYVIHRPADSINVGVGVVICPGGGFTVNWFDREGNELALLLADHGITSLVLNYRLNMRGEDKRWLIPMDRYLPAVLDDAKQAVRILRGQAQQYRLDPSKIGIVGYSSGGLLALRLAFDEEVNVPAGSVSWKPSFVGSIYGTVPQSYAIKKDICSPIFIINAFDDNRTPSSSCLRLYSELLAGGVPAEMHLYSKGGHGFDIDATKGVSLLQWPQSFIAWLKDLKMM